MLKQCSLFICLLFNPPTSSDFDSYQIKWGGGGVLAAFEIKGSAVNN